jgi:hypothetical protein
MADAELNIVDGPTKPDLQWALAHPERHLHIHFDTGRDAVDAHIDEMHELDDGTRFALKGHLTSGAYKGWPFKAVYDVASRSGLIKAIEPAPPSRA